jgi:hypothetical protein
MELLSCKTLHLVRMKIILHIHVIDDEWYNNLYRVTFAVGADGDYCPRGPAMGQAE